MPRFTTRAALAAATIALVLVAAFGAYAYWTTTGSGSGSADAASSNGSITLHASFSTGIYPGGTKTVSFTADNGGASNLFVTTIHLDSVGFDAGHSGCSAADFTMSDVASNTVVLASASGQALTGSGTLAFANTAVDQGACKGATITLNVSST